LVIAAVASLEEGNGSLSEALPGYQHFNFGENFRLAMGVNIAGIPRTAENHAECQHGNWRGSDIQQNVCFRPIRFSLKPIVADPIDPVNQFERTHDEN
jgi:hypothetical protein